jgi:hypothetical protein
LFLGLTLISKAQTRIILNKLQSFKEKCVSRWKVDYFKIKKSPGELIYILDNIAKLDTKFSDKSCKAFWINVYNLQVIKGVVDKFPIASVETIPGFFYC